MEIDKDKHIRKSHNKNALLYHIVCPVGYRRKVINEKIAETLKNICVEIGERFEIHFMEIGDDSDHVHFLVQSVPTMTPKNIVQTIKSITARELFKHHPEIRKMLWGGKFLDKRLLYKYSRSLRWGRINSKLCKKSRRKL